MDLLEMKFFHFFIPFLLLFSCSTSQVEKEATIYLFPESLRGQVIVVYGVNGKEEAQSENGVKLFNIPKSGTLYTSSKIPYGLSNDTYFLKNSKGKRKEIEAEGNTSEPNAICVYNSVTGTVEINGKDHAYEGFMICRKDSIAYYNDYELLHF